MSDLRDAKRSLSLPSDCSIGAIRGVHESIREAFSRQDRLEIDCSSVEKADVTSIQLLISTTRTGSVQGRKVVLTAISKALRNTMRRAGFSSDEMIARHFHQKEG